MENSKSKYDEQLFIKRLADLAQGANKKLSASFTDFLDPRLQIIASDYFKINKGIYVDFFGGYEEAERKICSIYNEDIELEKGGFPIQLFKICWKSHIKISHRDILGSLLGIGIKREKIGDIIQHDEEAFVYIHKDIAGYVVANTEKVGSVSISIDCCEGLPEFSRGDKITSAVVASLRLDCILAAGLGLSRAKAAEAIKSSKVFVNWKLEDSSSKEVKAGDVISWRGKGRIKLDNVMGTTKKDRIKVNIKKYI